MLFTTEQLISFSLATLGLAALPGPDLLYVLLESAQNGIKKGLSVATGLVSGVFAHTALVASGISLLLINSEKAFWVVKIGGAAYLLYLGIMAFRSSGAFKITRSENQVKSNWTLFKRGIFMNLVNPKVSLFFIAFLPQFIDAKKDIITQSFILGILFILLSWLVFALASALSSRLTALLQNPKIQRRIQLGKGVFFVLIALQIVLL